MKSENKLDEFFNQNKIPIAVGVVGLVLLVGGIISSGIIPKTFIKSSKYPSVSPKETSTLNFLKVDVSGAVVNPGVYSLSEGTRIEDAIKSAGGVTSSADPAFVSKSLNLAQKVVDGMKIYVPKVTEAGQSAVAGETQASNSPIINVNLASLSELDKLPGVGPVTAQNIIDKRPYESIEELIIKKTVSKSTYDKIKTMVSVN